MKTATRDRPIATSYEITCADDLRPPSSAYVEPDDQPASTIPYTPTEATARMNSTPTERSVSCSGVSRSVNGTDTTGPSGMTENATNAAVAEITGARMNTTLSAAFGTMSSLRPSLMPSARDCSRPNGPWYFGPTRCCIRATTLRSPQIVSSVISTSRTNTRIALRPITHHGS